MKNLKRIEAKIYFCSNSSRVSMCVECRNYLANLWILWNAQRYPVIHAQRDRCKSNRTHFTNYETPRETAIYRAFPRTKPNYLHAVATPYTSFPLSPPSPPLSVVYVVSSSARRGSIGTGSEFGIIAMRGTHIARSGCTRLFREQTRETGSSQLLRPN